MRAINLLKLLLHTFRRQPLGRQLLFCILILLLMGCIVLFFSAYLVWWVIQFIFKEALLRSLEWYLLRIQLLDEISPLADGLPPSPPQEKPE